MNECFICLSYVPMEMMKRVGLSILSPLVLCKVRENWVFVRIEKWADRREEWASGQKYGALANLSSDARPYLKSRTSGKVNQNRRTR